MPVGSSAEYDAEDAPPLLVGDDDDDGVAVSNQHDDDELTIMDEMVQVATRAREAKRRQQARERAPQGFGAGLKRGFFSQTAKKSKAPERLEVLGRPARSPSERLKITQKSQSDSEKQQRQAPVFPEVQQALRSMDKVDPKEWMNDRMFEKLAQRPDLMRALQHPRFSRAIQELQSDPQAALQQYAGDTEVSAMLQAFLGFLGDHFAELGQGSEPGPAPTPAPAIVDLDAQRRQAIANMPRSADEEAQVQAILDNPALLSALSDPALMAQLRRAQAEPRLLRELLADPTMGPRLRLLIEAGLIKFA